MGSYADDLASVSISRTTRTPTAAGFGTALILAYHSLYVDRVRAYGSLAEMVADGFTPYDPAYLAAQSAFAQAIAPASVKVGRRALAYTQVVDVTPDAPVSASVAETYTVKVDGLAAAFTSDATPTLSEVCTGVAAAINALRDADAIVATAGSTAGTQTLTGATLDGATGGAAMSTPRFVTFAFSASADWDATSVTLTGLDGNGASQSETIAVPNGGDATVTSTKRYLQVTSIAIPAQSGTGGTLTVGVRAPVTAVASGGTKVVCTSAAGELHSFERVTGNLSLKTQTTNPGVATDLAAVLAADGDWYGLLLDSQGAAEIAAAAAWVESNKRLFVWNTSDTDSLATGGTASIFYTTKAAGYVRSAGIYHPKLNTSDAWAAAAWMGEEFPKEPGASTWAFKSLAGVSVYDLTTAQRTALEAKNGNHYLSVGGLSLTGPGESASAEWLDIVRDLDWLSARLQEAGVGVFASNDKVPFTDEGISLLLTAVRAVLNTAVTAGVLASGFTLTAPKASAVSTSNKQARHLPSVSFAATLQGAIHSVAITGRVSA